MLAPLDNETIFKKVFTDPEVFQHFVKDIFDIDVKVSNIETEKQFEPPIANINIKLDIFAETDDHRFIIEIQKVDYDYNFNRFLNYFLCMLIEQQKKASKYAIPQTVLGIIVLTRPYVINELTGEPIHESVMSIDFAPCNLNDERIRIWKHKLVFLNPNPKYKNENTPQKYSDWLDLFSASISSNISIALNMNNKGIVKATKLAEFQNLDPKTIAEMKIAEEKKAMISIIENEGKREKEQEIVANCYKKGLSINDASELVGVSVETVSSIYKDLEKL